jgi:23S rRNA (guanosine2251-2'-O)-methyltransferase
MKNPTKKTHQISANSYYIYGKHSAIEALKNKMRKILDIYCTRNIYSEYQDIIEQFKYNIVDHVYIDNILHSDLNHQGILITTESLAQENFSSIDLTKDKSVIVILDQITDPQNIGAIIRNAASFSADAIITTKVNAALESSLICKISAGSIEKINLIRISNIVNCLEFLQSHGYWIVGLDGNAEEILSEKYLKGKIAFILGSEGEGLRKLIKEKTDFLYKIPISNVESLNVASASAIALYAYYLANK